MTIAVHSPAVFPQGFLCASRNCGLKESARDLTLFYSTVPAAAAAVFTRNHFPGAPVIVGRERIQRGRLQAIVVNSKVSNVGTGEPGLENARRMARAAAQELGIDENTVLMSSTGVIGVPLPIEKIERGLQGMKADLQADPLVGAEGIMTTDTHPKAISASIGGATITIVAKGAGMIEPNMATMLAYIFTDAKLEAATLKAMLPRVVEDSFNMLSVDSDTSTSDTCVLLANGLAGAVDEADFEKTLRALCIRMTEILARDGEGATKLLRIHVKGAATREEARRIAKTVVNSPLIKTMAFGADPNVGRILMAVGKCFGCTIEPTRLNGWSNQTQVIANGTRAPFDEQALRLELRNDPIDIYLDIGVGSGEAIAYGCDLTAGYIEENAAYYSS